MLGRSRATDYTASSSTEEVAAPGAISLSVSSQGAGWPAAGRVSSPGSAIQWAAPAVGGLPSPFPFSPNAASKIRQLRAV